MSFLRLVTMAKTSKLGRTENHIRQKIVIPLVSDGKLELKYPNGPRHNKQAYKTKLQNIC